MNDKRPAARSAVDAVGVALFALALNFIASLVKVPDEWRLRPTVTTAIVVVALAYAAVRLLGNTYSGVYGHAVAAIGWLFIQYRGWLFHITSLVLAVVIDGLVGQWYWSLGLLPTIIWLVWRIYRQYFRVIRVLVVGPDDISNAMAKSLGTHGRFKIETAWPSVDDAPAGNYHALLFPSMIDPWHGTTEREAWEKVADGFVRRGGGLVGVHDALFFYLFKGAYGVTTGGRLEHSTTMTEKLFGLLPRMSLVDNEQLRTGKLIWLVNQQAIDVEVADPFHEANIGLRDFRVDDELIPLGVSAEVIPFLTTEPLDTDLHGSPYWFKRCVLAGGRYFGKGRTAFTALGHSSISLSDHYPRKTLRNLVIWVSGGTKGVLLVEK